MSTESKSTDKLEIMENIIGKISDEVPEDKMEKLKSVIILWEGVSLGEGREAAICPCLKIEFFE